MALSFDDMRELVRSALDATIKDSWTYIREMYMDKVIYEIGSDQRLYRRSYSITDGVVILGEAVEVEEVYVAKQFIDITVESLDGVTSVEEKPFDAGKGVFVLMAGEKIVQYRFDKGDKAAVWTEETACQYIAKLGESAVCQSMLGGSLETVEAVKQAQAAFPADVVEKLKQVDSDPMIVPLRVNYGLGSNKQRFGKAFFQTAGAKFVGTPFMVNHSDLSEFGKAIPIGSIVQFAGAYDDHALFQAYVSASEPGLRQKIRESQALGDLGFVKKISIEGIPSRSDFKVEQKTGIKDFHDLTTPTGIAIVIKEGLKGSQIL